MASEDMVIQKTTTNELADKLEYCQKVIAAVEREEDKFEFNKGAGMYVCKASTGTKM